MSQALASSTNESYSSAAGWLATCQTVKTDKDTALATASAVTPPHSPPSQAAEAADTYP